MSTRPTVVPAVSGAEAEFCHPSSQSSTLPWAGESTKGLTHDIACARRHAGRYYPPMPQHKSMVSPDFEPPISVVTQEFVVRPLTMADADIDYEAWHTSLDHLRGIFGPASSWPRDDMSLEDNRVDLAWHQREHEARSSFTFTVLDGTQRTCLGCVYITPPRKVDYDSEVFYWVRASATRLDPVLGSWVRVWLAQAWPFTDVGYPGRSVSWETYAAMQDRDHW